MYDQFKNEVLLQLKDMSAEQLRMVSAAMDVVSPHFTISAQCTDLAVTGRKELMDTVRLYMVVRKSEGVAESTLKMNATILNRFVMDCSVPLNKITANMVRAWLYNYQQQRNISMRTLDLYRIVLCTFLKWCSIQGYMEKDITLVINKIKYERKPRKALSQLQLEEVRHVCQTKREHCIVETLYSTGCRVSELINIKLSDIDWSKMEITVLGKGKKTRVVYINAKAEYAIKDYINSRKVQSEYLIAGEHIGKEKIGKESIEHIFSTLAERCRMQQSELTPHIMRHTMATQAASTCPIQHVQRMLGHSSINTTMVYAEVKDDAVHAGHKLSVI